MFDKIIKEQESQKNNYVNGHNPPEAGISIRITDNKIVSISDSANMNNIRRKHQYIALIKNTVSAHHVKDCFININLRDKPKPGFFNFCRNFGKAEEFLLPNHRFTQDDIKIVDKEIALPTFDEEARLIQSLNTPYAEKASKFFTMTNFLPNKRDYLSYDLENKDICDAIIYLRHPQTNDKTELNDLLDRYKHNNMLTDKFIPFIKHSNYKYVIYNDGFSLSDRMRILLCLNSVIIKKKKKKEKWEEFYSYHLRPDVNYIAYSDESELRAIHDVLEKDPLISKRLIENNQQYIKNILTYTNITKYTADVINAVC